MKYALTIVFVSLLGFSVTYAAASHTEIQTGTNIFTEARDWFMTRVIAPAETFRTKQSLVWQKRYIDARQAAGMSAADDISQRLLPHQASPRAADAHIGDYIWYALMLIVSSFFGQGIIFYAVVVIVLFGILRAVVSRAQ